MNSDIGPEVNSLLLTAAGGVLEVEFSYGGSVLVGTGKEPFALIAGKDGGSSEVEYECCPLAFNGGVEIAVKF